MYVRLKAIPITPPDSPLSPKTMLQKCCFPPVTAKQLHHFRVRSDTRATAPLSANTILFGVKRSFLLKSPRVSERPCRCCFPPALSAVCFPAVLPMRSCVSSPPPGREHLPSSFPEETPPLCGLRNPSDPSWSSCLTFNGKHLLTAERLQVRTSAAGVKTAQHGAVTPDSKHAETHNTRVTWRDDTCFSTHHRA